MKKKNLGIIPTIYERRNSLNTIIELRVYKFIKSCFKNYNIIVLEECSTKNLDIIISLGGNSLLSLEKNNSNIFRKKLDKYYLKRSIKNKIPFLGICHGAQSLANLFKFKIIKKKGHTNTNHKVFFNKNKTANVNSYHDYSIVKLDKQFSKLAWTPDGSIEAFKHNKFPLLGIMWHPERYNKIKKFDLKFIKKNL